MALGATRRDVVHMVVKQGASMTVVGIVSGLVAAFGVSGLIQGLLYGVKRDAGDGVQLFRRNPKLCTPSDFDYSPYFEIIKYPFLDFATHSSYRLLPWSESSPDMTPHAEEDPNAARTTPSDL